MKCNFIKKHLCVRTKAQTVQQNNATKTHNPKSLQKIKVTAEHQIRKKWFGIYINPGVLPSQICQKRP